MARIDAYLMFDGNCREAMNFYKDCLGGDLSIQTIGESPMADEMPEAREKIMHAYLKNGDIVLMASDEFGTESREIIRGNNISLSLNCTSAEEISTFFAKLSEGGQVTQPLEEAFWGATFGMVTDRFGIHWMLNFDKNQQNAS